MQMVGKDLAETMLNMRLRLGTGYGMSNKEMHALLDQISDEMANRELKEARRDAVGRLSALSSGFMGNDGISRMGSHAALSDICRAVYEPPHGWTRGACLKLRDRLIWLLS